MKLTHIRKITKSGRYLVLCASLILLAACASNREVKNTQQSRLAFLFQSSADCSAPCWHSIRPGYSTKHDVQNLINTFSDDIKESLQCQPVVGNIERCTWRDRDSEFAVTIELRNDLVNHLRFVSTAGTVAYFPKPGEIVPTATFSPAQSLNDYRPVTLKDVFAVMGQPDEYSARIMVGRHGEFGLVLILFYQEGIVVEGIYPDFETSGAVPNCKVDVALDSPSTNIYFTPFTDLGQIIKGQNELALFSADDKAAVWTGANGLPLTTCDVPPGWR